MRYVEMYVRSTWSAFARADSFGNLRPANGPEPRIVDLGFGGLSWSVDGDKGLLSESLLPAPLDVRLSSESVLLRNRLTAGKCLSSMRVIGAKCEPASTASIEPLAQLLPTERTRKPVTLSSLGPPPEPRHITCKAAGCPCNPMFELVSSSPESFIDAHVAVSCRLLSQPPWTTGVVR